jgi:hypothetical protein
MNALYESRIGPMLGALERDRAGALKTFWWRIVPLAPLGVAGGLGVGFLFGDVGFMIMGMLLGAFGAWWYAYEPLRLIGVQAKTRTLHTIARELGCTYASTGFEPPALGLFQQLDLLPGCDRSSFEDRFEGAHHGCAFAVCDGHLEQKERNKNGGTSWRTLFRGQVIHIAFPKKFLGTTVVLRDAGFFNFLERWSTKLQRVGLVDSRLEKAFEVYASDQVEARDLIHPVFMERLLDLETAFKGKRLRCGFVDGVLLIAIEGGDRFEIGSMFRRLDTIARVEVVAGDLGGVVRVIDALLTSELSPLPA